MTLFLASEAAAWIWLMALAGIGHVVLASRLILTTRIGKGLHLFAILVLVEISVTSVGNRVRVDIWNLQYVAACVTRGHTLLLKARATLQKTEVVAAMVASCCFCLVYIDYGRR